jgi:hypothetical protein
MTKYININGEVTDKNESLVDVNRASELINQSGEYKQKQKTYALVNKSISRDTMLSMFKVSHQSPSFDIKDYQEPIFGRNLVEAIFRKKGEQSYTHTVTIDGKEHKLRGSTSILLHFRYVGDKNHKSLQPLKTGRNVLENTTLAFNEALFVLLGFNTVLAPDYEIINSTHPIDAIMLDTEQGQALNRERFEDNKIDIDEFLDFAIGNKFLKVLKNKNKKTEATDNRQDIVKNTLLDFINQKNKSVFSISTLTNSISFRNLLKKNGLTIVDELEANYTPDNDNINAMLTTLRADLYAILKSDWWYEKTKDIKKRIKYTPRIKKN